MTHFTIKELLKIYKPGIIFGGIIGFFVESYVRTLSFEDNFFVKFMSFDVQYKGVPIIIVFAIIGAVVQYYFKWK